MLNRVWTGVLHFLLRYGAWGKAVSRLFAGLLGSGRQLANQLGAVCVAVA